MTSLYRFVGMSRNNVTMRITPSHKPRIILLADKRNWAFDFTARSVSRCLGHRFDISIRYVQEEPRLDPNTFDVMYVFFWGTKYPNKFGVPSGKLIREVASFRWNNEERFGKISTEEFVETRLRDCVLVATPSQRLQKLIGPVHGRTFWRPNGFEPSIFVPPTERTGGLKLGWVGNASDPCKGFQDIIEPVCRGRFDLESATGSASRYQCANLYKRCDVISIASTAEAEPLTMVELLAAGCFPVAVDVGIIPELIRHEYNGLIVERTPNAFREAFEWCEKNLDRVRAAGRYNARMAAGVRRWNDCAARFGDILDYALKLQIDPGAASPPELPEDIGTLTTYEALAPNDDPTSSEAGLPELDVSASERVAWRLRDKAVAIRGKMRHWRPLKTFVASLRRIGKRITRTIHSGSNLGGP